MHFKACFVLLSIAVLGGCTGTSAPSTAGTSLSFPWSHAFVGVASSSCTVSYECMRGPAFNTSAPISGISSAVGLSVSSSDATIASGTVVSTGAGGQADPALRFAPLRAGTARLTVTGLDGESASLPITVTTISTLTLTLNGLPTATSLAFAVAAPPNANCQGFEGGYTGYWRVSAPPAPTIIENFPAMGNGPSDACIFSSVDIRVMDVANVTLAEKMFTLPIVLGRDNPIALSLP